MMSQKTKKIKLAFGLSIDFNEKKGMAALSSFLRRIFPAEAVKEAVKEILNEDVYIGGKLEALFRKLPKPYRVSYHDIGVTVFVEESVTVPVPDAAVVFGKDLMVCERDALEG